MMHHRIFIGFITLLLCSTVYAEEAMPVVYYDQVKDTLSVEAKEASLKRVLTLVAMKSGVDVQFDDLADQAITMSFEDQPLKAGLENMLRQSNYAFRYSKADDGKMVLVGLMVLPAGDERSGDVTPLAHVAGGVFMYEKGMRMLSAEEIENRQEYNRRWQARIGEMPPDVREKVLQHARERLDEAEQRMAQREQRSQERKAALQERKAAREERQQEHVEAMTPEDRIMAEQFDENVRLNAQLGQLPWQQDQ